MKRRVAAALLAFVVMMVCFGILSRAVDDTSVALVATEHLSTQVIERETDDEEAHSNAAEGDAGRGSGNAEAVDTTEGVGVAILGTSPEYTACVPLLAVHRDGAQSFVYVIAEQSGFLGIELVARKVNVTVLDSGKDYAALSDGAISSQQDVIVRSDRVLADGSKVRVADA